MKLTKFGSMGTREIVVALPVLTLLLFRRGLLDAFDAFREGINNFRGGPPTPRHPLPAAQALTQE
jgi:hypothetical protein